MSIDAKPVKHRGAIAWMAGNSVAANLVMVVLLVGGLISALRIKQEVFPEFSMDMVQVRVPYPGASPEEVEQGIILAIEEEVRGLDGVDKVSSVAAEGMGVVTIQLLLGEDGLKLSQDVQSAVDRIVSFPEEIERPQVTLLTHRSEVISLVLYAETDENILRDTAEQVRDRLLQDPGITQVELAATRPYEIAIEVSQDHLRTYNLTLEDVAARLRAAAVELPGGGIKTQGGEILLRVSERRDFGREFARTPILTRPDGTQLLLEDLAVVKDGFEDTDVYAEFNGKPALMVKVFRVGSETPIEVASVVKGHVEALRHTLPEGIGVDTLNDFSEIYKQRAELLMRNAAIGLVLVLILLSVFLETRLAFWVTMGIPISFLGAILLLPLFDVSLNMISLFAFIVALGIVVDDAIVVGENVYEYHQRGLGFREAAVRGAREVAMPVTFSILTNVAAFMPMFFVPGIMGKIFKVIPAVVVLVFLISLVESLFVLPAHLGHRRESRGHGVLGRLHRAQQRFSNWFSHIINDRYGPFLDLCLRYRYITVAAAFSILMVTIALVASGRLGLTMFPKVESDFAIAKATLAYGTPVERTQEVQQQLVNALYDVADEVGREQLIEGAWASIGLSGIGEVGPGGEGSALGGHITEVILYLTDPEVRPISTDELTRRWRERVGRIPGLQSLTFESDAGGPGSGKSLTVELSHRDLGVLEAASAELAEALAFYPNVKDIDDGFIPGKRQFDFKILPEGESLGLTAREVARQVRNSFYGAEVLRQQRGRNELKVMVRLPKSERVSEHNLEELMVRTPAGIEVPLREVVHIERGRAYTSINRRDGRRVVSATADVEPRDQTGKILESLRADTLPGLMEKYPGLRFGFEGKEADMQDSMNSLKVGFFFAMMVIYTLLAVPFKSYVQPLIIMVSIPFGIVGAVIGHLVMGFSLSIMSMFGIVALSGVVVNDSLVLIDYANREHRKGKHYFDAIHAAGVRRFRPIMLTTLTTFGGLAPMIFEQSMQARFLIPMALSLGYGILFATLITLILVPSLYIIAEDIRHLLTVEEPEAGQTGINKPSRAESSL